mmetsp:Transcript_119699/g.290504  ORF Transcript_119699/g.290504 Transcript_119699/m.290504 type:complete len:114 (-) Transcript_119699:279-620(-)
MNSIRQYDRANTGNTSNASQAKSVKIIREMTKLIRDSKSFRHAAGIVSSIRDMSFKTRLRTRPVGVRSKNLSSVLSKLLINRWCRLREPLRATNWMQKKNERQLRPTSIESNK